MILDYKVHFKNNVFKYDCVTLSSYIRINYKDIKKIYYTLNKLDVLQEQAEKAEKRRLIYNGFEIIFDFSGYFAINTISNWLNMKEEVPIIKRKLSKYVKEYNTDNIKDIIIKIKSLKKGSSNRIKEDLK